MRAVTRAALVRYRPSMNQNLAWVAGLVTTVLAVSCGGSSNFVGEEPQGGAAGSAGSSSAGKGSAGAAQAGDGPSGGSKSTAGSGSGGASIGGSDSNGGTGMGGSKPQPECTDLSGNWVSCDNGVVHRDEPGTCQSELPRPNGIQPTQSELDECVHDNDCTAKPHGYCNLQTGGGFVPVEPHNACSYGCVTDADCGQGQACLCGSPIGTCRSATGCASDQSCADGALCIPYDSCPGVPVKDFACQTPNDACASNADCSEPGKQFCTVVDDRRTCVGVMCAAAAGQ